MKEDTMLGKEVGRPRALPLWLALAFAVYLISGLPGKAYAKDASAGSVFAAQAFAAEADKKEGKAGEEPKVEWSKDVFYKDAEGNPGHFIRFSLIQGVVRRLPWA